MKTTSLDTTSLIGSTTTDKTAKQGNLEQAGTSFSNVINSISTTNQNMVTDLTNKKPSTLKTKDTNITPNTKNVVNAAIKNKLHKCDSDCKDASQLDKIDTSQNGPSDVAIAERNDKQNAEDVLDEASKEIKNILLDALNISEEDLESAMQVLGLEYLDCLDKNNLTQLLMQVSGNSDISALITDETLYQQFNDVAMLVNGVKEDILAELGITEEELMATLEQINSNKQVNDMGTIEKESDTTVIVGNSKESAATHVNVQEQEESSLKQDKNVTSAANEISSEATDKIKAVTADAQDNSEQHAANSKQESTTKTSDTLKANDIKDYNQEYTLGQVNQDNVLNSNVENVVPIKELTTINVEDIIKQVQNQIKVSANADTTAMEFQLNPEHLGKLTIQIASKEGMITAQIATQNLEVKEVIESQIIQLRENMNNQGLKVDAVEVTVESHEFERNLDEGNRNANQEQFEQQEKNGRRQLNYNSLESLDDLTVDEALVAQMMIGNGNSINYTA